MKKNNSNFNSKDFFSVLAIVVIVGFVLFTGVKKDISGEVIIRNELYGGSAIDAGFVAPAAKIYGGAIHRIQPYQFAAGKAFVLPDNPKPARTYADNPSYETICPANYDRVRIEDAAFLESQGYEIVLPGGNIGMNRFACKSKVRG